MGWKDRKYFVEAQNHIELQNWNAAEQPLTELLLKAPDHAEALLHRAYVRMRKAEWSAASEDIDCAARLRPDSGVMKMLQGEILFALQRCDEALLALREAVSLEPDNGRALYFLGQVYKALGHREEAAEAYEKALQFDRDFVMAHWMTEKS